MVSACDLPDLRVLQEDWDGEARRQKLATLRGEARLEARLRALAPLLDRWSTRLAWFAIGSTAALFAFHAVRFALRVRGLA